MGDVTVFLPKISDDIEQFDVLVAPMRAVGVQFGEGDPS